MIDIPEKKLMLIFIIKSFQEGDIINLMHHLYIQCEQKACQNKISKSSRCWPIMDKIFGLHTACKHFRSPSILKH